MMTLATTFSVCGMFILLFGIPHALTSKHSEKNTALVITVAILFFLVAGLIADACVKAP